MKYYISQETGSVLTMLNGKLCFTAILNNDTFDTEDFSPVDELATENEPIAGFKHRYLRDVYRLAKRALID